MVAYNSVLIFFFSLLSFLFLYSVIDFEACLAGSFAIKKVHVLYDLFYLKNMFRSFSRLCASLLSRVCQALMISL